MTKSNDRRLKQGLKACSQFIKHVYREWREDGTHRLGASVAYYGLIALIPYLVIMIVVALIVFSPQDIIDAVAEFANRLFGVGTIDGQAVKEAYATNSATNSNDSGTFAGLVGLVSFLITASLFIIAVQDALNVIWKQGRKAKFTISRYLFGFVVMLSGAATFTLGLGVRTVIRALQDTFDANEFFISSLFSFLTTAGFVLILTLFFMLLTKILVKVSLDIRSLAISSFITACLMILGEYGLSVYFARFADYSYYGAVSTYFIILFAIYYFAQIFMIGAQTGKVLSYWQGNKYLNKYLKKTDPRLEKA